MDSLIGTLFEEFPTARRAKQKAEAETSRTSVMHHISFTVSCLDTKLHFVAPIFTYSLKRLQLLKEIIDAGLCPEIMTLRHDNDNVAHAYTWDDIVSIKYGKTEHKCIYYRGPESIFLIPQEYEMRYGQCMAVDIASRG